MATPDRLVWIAGRGKHSSGRWHGTDGCGFIAEPPRRRLVSLATAEGLLRHACPYCCPLPPCCATGDHAGASWTPAVPLAPSELPDWEAGLLAAAGALPGECHDA